jgi:hypothetical protein
MDTERAGASPVDGQVRPVDEALPMPEARKPDEHGAGWFTAGQMLAYAAESAAEERERIASFHFNQLEHEALSAITLDVDWSDTRARLAYARKVSDATARSFAWQLKQFLKA